MTSVVYDTISHTLVIDPFYTIYRLKNTYYEKNYFQYHFYTLKIMSKKLVNIKKFYIYFEFLTETSV